MATLLERECLVVVGKESAGKSQLIQSLTGRPAQSANFRGVTVACEVYPGDDVSFVDTPGIFVGSDAVTTQLALERLRESERVLIAVRGTHLDADLADLLPLGRGKRGLIVVTFWDKARRQPGAAQTLERLRATLGVPVVALDTRHVTAGDRDEMRKALANTSILAPLPADVKVGWRVEPPPTVLDHPRVGPALAAALMLLPAIVVVWSANNVAAWLEPAVQSFTARAAQQLAALPEPLASVATGRYGLVTMGPLLFVWSVPTVLLFALLLAIYKATGLIDRIAYAVHPFMLGFGLTGRDLIRIVMGFGCNVPAVVSTRACCSATRGACISMVAFASACSYQMGATLAAFGAAGSPALVVPYLALLTGSALVHAKLISRGTRRGTLLLVREGRAFLEWPRPIKIWHEARGTLRQFFGLAIPLFLVISVVASLLDWLGIITLLATATAPAAALFHLPAEAALPVVLASIRKDGILLFAEPNLAASMTPGQLLTGVYLAGVLLPCLVTAFTIAVEQSARFALRLVVRQAAAALVFTFILAQAVALFGL